MGIVTGYGLDGPGSNTGGGEIFRTCPERPCWRSLLTMCTRSFPWVKSGRCVTLTPRHFLVPWSRMSRAIRLLPLWAVRPVQSLSACTRVKLTFTICTRGPGSSGGIATGYGLDGPAIESGWGRNFPHLSRPAMGLTQPPVKWVPGLGRGQRATGGVTLNPRPSSAVVKKK